MGKLLRHLLSQIPSLVAAAVFALMFGLSPQEWLLELVKPFWSSPPDWLFSLQFRAVVAASLVALLLWRISRILDGSRVALRFDRRPYLFDTDQIDSPHPHRYAHVITIANTGTRDLEAKMLVKVLEAWNEKAMVLTRLPYSARPESQVRQDRNRPFNLRVGEPKRVVLGFCPSLVEPVHVEFVNGLELHPVPFDQQMTRWLMVRIGAFGAQFPTYETAIFVLRDNHLTFRRATWVERLVCSYAMTRLRFWVARGARRLRRAADDERRIWRTIKDNARNGLASGAAPKAKAMAKPRTDTVGMFAKHESNPKQTLPLSITAIKAPGYWRYSGLPTTVHFSGSPAGEKVAEVDPPNLNIQDVFISNISLTRSVTLKIALAITDKDGKTHRLSADGRNAFGMVLGRNDPATRTCKERGDVPPSYIVSPVRIGPQETVHGAFVFVINAFSGDGGPFDEKVLEFYVRGSALPRSSEELFRYALEIEDVVSGVSISIPLPSDAYKGLE